MRISAHSVARLSAIDRVTSGALPHRSATRGPPGIPEGFEAGSVRGPAKSFARQPKRSEIFLRNIHAPHFVVAAHVANNIRQLKRKSQPLGQIGRFRIAKSKHMQARQPHRTRHAITIFRKAVECWHTNRWSNPFPRRESSRESSAWESRSAKSCPPEREESR